MDLFAATESGSFPHCLVELDGSEPDAHFHFFCLESIVLCLFCVSFWLCAVLIRMGIDGEWNGSPPPSRPSGGEGEAGTVIL